MTIESIYAPQAYDLTPRIAVSFPFNWEVIESDDIVVLIDGVVVSSGLYTVSVTGQAPIYSGGSVTFPSPPEGISLSVARRTDRTQLVDYIDGRAFPETTHEFALDKLTMICQEIDVDISNA